MGSFKEEYSNHVEIITRKPRSKTLKLSSSSALQLDKIPHKRFITSAVNDETGKFTSDPRLTFPHPYPATKIMFIPDKDCIHPDLVATTGDYLRIWQVKEDSVQLLKLLNNVRFGSPNFQVKV